MIATERQEAGHIDRQLFGRCGSQGDPGSYEAILSLHDELITLHTGGGLRWLVARMVRPGRPLPRWIAWPLVRWAQRAAERMHSRMRRDLLKLDEQLDLTLAFSGQPE